MVHRLEVGYISSWPIWQYFDAPPGRRIAVTAGWDPPGHNWYRYPLLGGRLQNHLHYVPITTDGSIVNYRDSEQVARRSDFAAWLRRLVNLEIQYVVTLPPDNTIESRWMTSHPRLFGLVPQPASCQGGVHQVHLAAARRWLDGQMRPLHQAYRESRPAHRPYSSGLRQPR
jgi:hypothetical protein